MPVFSDVDVLGSPVVTGQVMDALRAEESGGRADATSPKGAVGPYQFMPETYRGFGLTEAQARDDVTARPHAQKMLQRLTDRFGSLEAGLAAYNWGEGNVAKFGAGKAPAETHAYVQKVMGRLAGPKRLTDNEVLGSAGKPPKPQSAGVRIGQDVAGIADLLTTGPAQMIADVMGQTVGRVVAGLNGASRDEAIDFGKEFGSQIASHPLINQPLTKLFNWVSHQDRASDVDSAMGKVTDLIAKGGKYVEQKTGGVVRAGDVELMLGALMAGAGARGQQAFIARMEKPAPGSINAWFEQNKPAIDEIQRKMTAEAAPPSEVPKGGKGTQQGLAGEPDLTRIFATGGLGAGLASYAYAHRQDEGGTLASLGLVGMMGSRASLESAMRDSGYTMKTLERLPQNHTEFTREQVEQQLNRQDVSKAERELVQDVLGDKKKIAAQDLVNGFRNRADMLRLKPEETTDYADYGLDTIGRTGNSSARTTIYESPIELGNQNHFDNPNYFAHTRSFDEDGVRHVVEVQSDVAQHAKLMSSEEAAAAKAKLESVEQELDQAYAKFYEAVRAQSAHPNNKTVSDHATAQQHLSEVGLRYLEARAALGPENIDQIEPMLKNWYKRIVRQELARTPGKPVRFATADTVAKVEGWPQRRLPAGGTELSPEHQSIYNRYKGEIEKFLRNDLNAKPYTDQHGHTWLEVPPQPRGPIRMFGRASTADLATLAAFVGGALAMHAWQNDPSLVADAAAGMVAALGVTRGPSAVAAMLKAKGHPLETIADVIKERESHIRLAVLDATNRIRQGSKEVPDEARRAAVQARLDAGSPAGLSHAETKLYYSLRGEYMRLDRLLKPSVLVTIRAGLPQTSDALVRYAAYSNAVTRAFANQRLLGVVKRIKSATGDPLIAKASTALADYETINHPQLRGLSVHPDIAPQVKFVFDNPSSAGWVNAIETIADVTKRSAVSASLFHAKALIDVLVAAVPGKARYFAGAVVGAGAGYALGQLDDHPGRDAALLGTLGYVGPRLKAFATGRSAFLDEMKKGSNSAYIQRSVKAGLVFGAEKGPLVVDDAGRKFYDMMRVVQHTADRIAAPVGIKAGRGVEAYIKANHWMDDMMWGRLHPGMKLEVWGKTSEMLRENSLTRHARDPNAKVLSVEEADAIAAKYTNDLFGGLDWTGIAMESQSRIGRRVAQSLLSPKGRQFLRIAMFAPDWTVSTARSALAAVDSDLVNPLKWGNVARGFFEPVTRGDLARLYIARSALYYLVVGDAINYSMSGHHLWENDKKVGWSFIDWGDGRRMQFSKHIMEVPHWAERPTQQALGKLGYVPKETVNQALGTEYLAPHEGRSGNVVAGPKMKDSSALGRVGHASQGLVPIPLQGKVLSDSAAWGFFGMPIYGKTREQLAEDRAARRRKRRNP